MEKSRNKIFVFIYITFILIYLLSGSMGYISYCCIFVYKGQIGYAMGRILGFNIITFWISLLPIIFILLFLFKNKINEFLIAGLIECLLIFLHLYYVYLMVSNPPSHCHAYGLDLGFYIGFASWILLCVLLLIFFLIRKSLLTENDYLLKSKTLFNMAYFFFITGIICCAIIILVYLIFSLPIIPLSILAVFFLLISEIIFLIALFDEWDG